MSEEDMQICINFIKNNFTDEESIRLVFDSEFYSGIQCKVKKIHWMAPFSDPDEVSKITPVNLPSYRGLFFALEPGEEEIFSLVELLVGYEPDGLIRVEAYLQDGVFTKPHSTFPVPAEVIPAHLGERAQGVIHVIRSEPKGTVKFSEIDL